jgi:hypothetical protein
VRHAYGFDRVQFARSSTTPDGSGQTIAIVTAYDYANLVADLAVFDTRFHLPDAQVTKMGQDGSSQLPAAADPGWTQEATMDVEWAHAIAPGATLLIVEAKSADEADLYTAVDTAVHQSGVSVIAMSFGQPEDQSETQADGHFLTPQSQAGITFVAAAGDSGVVSYPAASPYVLGVGGTTLSLDSAGNRLGETAWANGGGGLSLYEPTPTFQLAVTAPPLFSRGTPDVAYDADPTTGFAVYDSSLDYGWVSIAGTSAGAPQWAALIAIADQGRALAGLGTLDGARQTLPTLYSLPSTDFNDIVVGGPANTPATTGYDLVTGLGTPKADLIIPALVSMPGSPSPSPTPGQPPGPVQPPGQSPAPGQPPTGPSVQAIIPGFETVAQAPFNYTLGVIFAPEPLASASTLMVTIDWGNGQVTSGSLTQITVGTFLLSGGSRYANAGSYQVSVSILDTLSHQTVTVTGTATVVPPVDPPLQTISDLEADVLLKQVFASKRQSRRPGRQLHRTGHHAGSSTSTTLHHPQGNPGHASRSSGGGAGHR